MLLYLVVFYTWEKEGRGKEDRREKEGGRETETDRHRR